MLEMEGIRLRRGGFILGPLDLGLSSGITGIIGPNGSGKSTLCRIAAGIHPPDSGRLRLLGQPFSSLSALDRAGLVTYVPQELPAAYGHTVREFVAMGYYRFSRDFYRAGKADAQRALDMVDLEAHAGQDFMSLSGGEKRRAALARALVQDTAILILDEPGSFLDYGHNRRMAGILRRIGQEQDKAVAIVSHNTDFLLEICTRVIGMNGGKIMYQGEAGDILRSAVTLSEIFATRFCDAGGRVLPDYGDGD